MLETLEKSPSNIYKGFGREGTEAKRRNWKKLEEKALSWWEEKYGFGGLSTEILRGLIRFCTYIDPKRKDIIKNG